MNAKRVGLFVWRISDELELALLEREDAAAISRLALLNREYLLPWMPWARSISPAAQLGFITGRALPAICRSDGFEAAILYRGRLVGMAGVHGVDVAVRKCAVGYWLAAGHQGKGIVTRVMRAVLERSFTVAVCAGVPFERVELRADVGNAPSRAVAARLGMHLDGVARHNFFAGSHYADLAVYSLLRSEWLARELPTDS